MTTKYYIVMELEEGELERKVNEMLTEGWECQGGICVVPRGDCYHYFAQAMIRRTK